MDLVSAVKPDEQAQRWFAGLSFCVSTWPHKPCNRPSMRPLHHHTIQAKLTELMPTQGAIGCAEVSQKRAEWQGLSQKMRKALIAQHWFPSVIGPEGRYYIVDHHHLGMALHEEGQEAVFLTVLKDLSWLDVDTFWRVMEFHQWAHPYSETGKRIAFQQLPTRVSELKDDPYRSLAGLARKAGAFAKDVTPFSEFLWADYFRPKIKKQQLQQSMTDAVALALEMARHPHASYLPGFVQA